MKHSIWLLMRKDGTLCEGWYETKESAVEDGEASGFSDMGYTVTPIEATYETKD